MSRHKRRGTNPGVSNTFDEKTQRQGQAGLSPLQWEEIFEKGGTFEKKPTPKPMPSRMPKTEMEKIEKGLGCHLSSEPRAVQLELKGSAINFFSELIRSIDNYNPIDLEEIAIACTGSVFSEIHYRIPILAGALPAENKTSVIEKLLKLFRTEERLLEMRLAVLELVHTLDKNDRRRVLERAIDCIFPRLNLVALKIICTLPDEERSGLFEYFVKSEAVLKEIECAITLLFKAKTPPENERWAVLSDRMVEAMTSPNAFSNASKLADIFSMVPRQQTKKSIDKLLETKNYEATDSLLATLIEARTDKLPDIIYYVLGKVDITEKLAAIVVGRMNPQYVPSSVLSQISALADKGLGELTYFSLTTAKWLPVEYITEAMKDFARKNNSKSRTVTDLKQVTARSIIMKIEPDPELILKIINFSTDVSELLEALRSIPSVSDKDTMERLWDAATGALQALDIERTDARINEAISLLPEDRRAILDNLL